MNDGICGRKACFHARAKDSMREFLRSKTCEEKVESIERINEASNTAQAAMKEAMAKQDPLSRKS